MTALPWPSYLASAKDLQTQADAEMQPRFSVLQEELRDIDAETRAVASRSAAEALHELAEHEGAEVIVLGSCHRGQIGRTLAGSVGESVIHDGPCAIAVAPRGYADRKQHQLLQIAVAFDGSPEAWTALEAGIDLAERCHGYLTIVTVADYVRYGYAATWSVLTAEEIENADAREKQRQLDLALAHAPEGLACEGRLLTGSRAYGPLRRTLLGSATRQLIRSSSCPVLVLPRAAGADPLGLRVLVATGAHAPRKPDREPPGWTGTSTDRRRDGGRSRDRPNGGSSASCRRTCLPPRTTLIVFDQTETRLRATAVLVATLA